MRDHSGLSPACRLRKASDVGHQIFDLGLSQLQSERRHSLKTTTFDLLEKLDIGACLHIGWVGKVGHLQPTRNRKKHSRLPPIALAARTVTPGTMRVEGRLNARRLTFATGA